MTIAPWYPGAATIPPNVPVRVIWGGWQGLAYRTKRNHEVVWATRPKDTGEVAYLPPRGKLSMWGPHPEAWQPVDPAKWAGALPLPMASVTGDSVTHLPPPDQADQADQGEAMQWWRDASRLTYSARGEISRHEAEGRVMRATAHAAAGRRQTLAGAMPIGVLARIVAASEDQPSDTPSVPRLPDLPRDGTDFLLAMAWFTALNPPELWHRKRSAWDLNLRQRVLVWRASDRQRSWGEIAWLMRRSRTRAAQVYDEAIDEIHRAANGRRMHLGIRVADQMALLRARNLEFARG